MKSILQFIICLVCLWTAPMAAGAQCNWGFATTADSSRCAASGKITVTINGPDAGNVSNRLYSLRSVTGSYEISHSSTPLFENLPAGDYDITTRGVCGGEEDSVTRRVTVPGNYVTFIGEALLQRASFPDCATGKVELKFANGRKNYKATITSKPAAYAGSLNFSTSQSELVISALPAGTYQFTLSDSCGSNASVHTVNIPELSPLTANALYLYDYNVLSRTACNKLVASGNVAFTDQNYQPYYGISSDWTFAVQLEGETKTAYKPVHYTSTFEITLPAGKTMKDYYGKKVDYFFKTPCGIETVIPVDINVPWTSVNYSLNCNENFNLEYYQPYYSLGCFPTYLTAENTVTGQIYRDTAYDYNTRSVDSLPFGSYRITLVTADGYTIYNQINHYLPVTGKIFRTMMTVDGGGMHNSAYLQVWRSQGAFKWGTKVEIIEPSWQPFSRTINGGAGTHLYSGNNANKEFTPANYIFKFTDECGVYYDTLVLRDTDVYKYDFDLQSRDTCAGAMVTVNGTATFHGQEVPMYYKVTKGPVGWTPDNVITPAGTYRLLNVDGDYELSVLANPGGGMQNSFKTNVAYYSLSKRTLTIDVNRTSGWICPGAPANSGAIQVYVQFPQPRTFYIYKLAQQGQGANGPFLATNTTGRFTSGSGYNLLVNQNYDVRVEDECGAFAIQTVKIIDFATAQLASLNKPAFCVNDTARLRVINLPGSATTWDWSGPGGWFSDRQNPVITNLGPQHAGEYRVVINTDICAAPIRDTVTLTLADFEIICYSAVTDTSVNPYTAGILGNWRPYRTYAYYGARRESDPSTATNIRRDGAYQDFMSFWKKQTTGWKAQYDTTRWVWNAESTLFNKKGFELENRDALNRYNNAIYAFEDALPIAVTQNARYREAAYEGFEDFYFKGNDCANGECPPGRRFDFTRYNAWLDSTERHTGRFSLKIPAGDTLQTSHETSDQAVESGKPVFEMKQNACMGIDVLKKVKADASMVLPPFAPLNGKKVLFSAWVKEAADCKCATYDKNVVQLIVKQGSQTFLYESKASGNIIEGWQRYETVVDLPAGSSRLSLMIIAKGDVPVYIDDIRIHPFNANMKSYAFDPQTLLMMAELDENNYATFFEYDDDGGLTRVKKETERGIKTIKETRSALVKE